ncbi:hypothetical protein SUDANB2_07161 [Streptomyces sp. enrichment culture]
MDAAADGDPQLMELDLVERSLFLSLHTGSVERVVKAVLRAAGSRPAVRDGRSRGRCESGRWVTSSDS